MSSRLMRDELQDLYKQVIGKMKGDCVLFAHSGAHEAYKSLLEVASEKMCILQFHQEFPEERKPEVFTGRWVESIVGDLSSLPIRESALDLILYAFTSKKVTEINPILSEARRVLKDRGALLLVDWTPSSRLKPPDVDDLKRFTDAIRSAFGRLFKPVDLRIYRDYFIVLGLKENIN